MVKKKTVKKTTKGSNGNWMEALGYSKVFQNEKLNFIIGIVLICISIIAIISFVSYFSTGAADQSILDNLREGDMANTTREFANYCGSLGAKLSDFLIRKCFGLSAFLIPAFLIMLGLRIMGIYKVQILKWFFCMMLCMVWCSVAFAKFLAPMFSSLHFNPGGGHGDSIMNYLENYIGAPGLIAVLVLVAIAFLSYVSCETIEVIKKVLNPVKYIRDKVIFTVEAPSGEVEETTEMPDVEADPDAFDNPTTNIIDWSSENQNQEEVKPEQAGQPESDNAQNTSITFEVESPANEEIPEDNDMQITVGREETRASSQTLVNVGGRRIAQFDPKKDLENYHYPVLDLLKKYDNDGQSYVDPEEQERNKNRIIDVLRQFGVEISSIKATIGPTITLYEITPAPGVRISKIKNLEDDIALSLAAKGIRIIAPIPGKGTIGIEVPNAKPRIVSMESILNSKKFQETTMELPIALGKTITNEVYMADLAKIPHLLVAGATGQGKSVGLNAIIASLLYKKHPAELKLVLVDPKKVEFSIYSSLDKHFLAAVAENEDEPIITDVTKVVRTLNSLCKEMDERYDLLKVAHVRNIKEYNEKFLDRQLNPLQGHRFMPYIVVVIDEFGDLILTAGKEIEMPITRIAQLARAVGIHMIIATQRPTTTIITGNIKANFPGRMAFKVTAVVDSRTILDRTGANQLVGRGDMLILNGAEPVRVQCAFLDTPEVERISDYISKQQGYTRPFELPEPDTGDADGEDGGADLGPLDPMFEEAAELIVLNQQGSTSLIQRKFSIGYNRAGRLMDQMEKAGIVGPAQGSKPREVFIQDVASLARIVEKYK
ncbi:MAG: DNA translocase FtsK 4TM domain-containing protein [Prevotellaceae bacterium]|nr:DNA translocase FtsK 4TM domain-containing protein [Prevotellaceae bacterium]